MCALNVIVGSLTCAFCAVRVEKSLAFVEFDGGIHGNLAGVIGCADGEPGDDGGVYRQVAEGEALVCIHHRVICAAVFKRILYELVCGQAYA